MAKSFNAQMQDRFTKIRSDYASVNAYVHETAVLIAEHAKEHNDCSLAQDLVMAMPASARREMLILWFSTYTPIATKNDKDFKSKMRKPEDKLFKPFDIEAGKAKPFHELAKAHKERPPLTYADLVTLPTKQAKRLERMIEEGQIEANEVETVKALISAFKSIRVVHVEPAADNDKAPEAPAQDAAEAAAARAAAEAATTAAAARAAAA